MVKHKNFCIKTKWKETNLFVTSSTGEGIRSKANGEQTWREVVMKNSEYYYDLEEVCGNRAAYRPKAMSAGITSAGYAPNVVVVSSDLNGDDKDGDEAINDDVPENIQANLDADGLYNTPTDRSWLTSDTSTTEAKKAHNNSKNSSNNLSTHFKTCVDNFGNRVLATWSCKDPCEQFLKFLTPAKREELKQMELDEANNVAC